MPTLPVDGGSLYYEERGVGPPAVILVHGFGCSSGVWAPQTQALSVRNRVIACDLRGHGRSEPKGGAGCVETLGEDLASLIRSLPSDPSGSVVIGHSMGCRVVLEAVRLLEDRVRGVGLIDGSWTQPAHYPSAVAGVAERIALQGVRGFVTHEFAQMFTPAIGADLRERLMAQALAMPEDFARELYLRTMEWDVRMMESVLSSLKQPVLVVQNTAVLPDRTRVTLRPGMSTPWLELIGRVVPHAEVHVLHGAGHFVMLERPETVNRLLLDFVGSLTCP